MLKSAYTYLIRLIAFVAFFIFQVSFTVPNEDVATGKVLIKIQLTFNGQSLVLNNQKYCTANGDTVIFNACKFYLSSFELTGNDNNLSQKKNNYFLVNAEDEKSEVISLGQILLGEYANLSFNIGVDSFANVSGAMNGALDPIHGMYWTWNTGYINAKLQGTSAVCKTRHNEFEFHIGGYSSPFNSIRKVSLQHNKITVSKNNTTVIHLNADVAAWFYKPNLINLSTTNNIVIPGKEAMLIADNYATMFSLN